MQSAQGDNLEMTELAQKIINQLKILSTHSESSNANLPNKQQINQIQSLLVQIMINDRLGSQTLSTPGLHPQFSGHSSSHLGLQSQNQGYESSGMNQTQIATQTLGYQSAAPSQSMAPSMQSQSSLVPPASHSRPHQTAGTHSAGHNLIKFKDREYQFYGKGIISDEQAMEIFDKLLKEKQDPS
jgi:hypothetical protein